MSLIDNNTLELMANMSYVELRPFIDQMLTIYRQKAKQFKQDRYKLDAEYHDKILSATLRNYKKKPRCEICQHFPKGCRCTKDNKFNV